ncbi:universal stress protein [Microbacterium luticocti]|uniref:universal stress protein n=1 Tax=Microbacterium luticocti TaxID=451764 RepID=UPI0003F762C4|nr:universal stress protein [Microbacterium luticocti]
MDDIDTGPVLVGVDGSDSSIDALRHAARLAQALDAPLEAVTVWEYPAFADYYAVVDWSPEADAQATLESAIDQAFGGAPPTGLRRTVLRGPTARALIDASRRAGMLVLGSRGHGGFAGLLLGSVSAACAAHARCPVLIVHGRHDDRDLGEPTTAIDTVDVGGLEESDQD